MWPIIHQISGVILIIFGAITLPLPLPTGLIALALGFTLLAPYFPPVQSLVRSLRTKHPNLDEKLISYRHRLPTIMKTTIDQTTPLHDHTDAANPEQDP